MESVPVEMGVYGVHMFYINTIKEAHSCRVHHYQSLTNGRPRKVSKLRMRVDCTIVDRIKDYGRRRPRREAGLRLANGMLHARLQ